MTLDEYRAANLANWDERVAGHIGPGGYDLDGLVDDPNHLSDVVAFDRDVFGDVTGKRLLHSQCHIGTDTLSWAKLGAIVTGIDFSPAALAVARDLAARGGWDATFVETEFYDAPRHVHDSFDLVYTSVGALNWLPDMTGWARILAAFLEPGGQLYLREMHPMLGTLDDERDDDELRIVHPYFNRGTPLRWDEDSSYAGTATLTNTVNYEWPHSIGEVVTALLDAGLVIERLREHTHLDWPFFAWMEREGERFFLPASRRDLLPLQYSVLARKPVTVG